MHFAVVTRYQKTTVLSEFVVKESSKVKSEGIDGSRRRIQSREEYVLERKCSFLRQRDVFEAFGRAATTRYQKTTMKVLFYFGMCVSIVS
jgi:hypothetical protein